MATDIIKGSFRYATENRYHFLLLFAFMLILAVTLNYDTYGFFGLITNILLFGYGLQVTKDIIGGGSGLPKIMLKKSIVLGIKGTVVSFIYLTVQGFILVYVSRLLKFPNFDLEELLVHLPDTINMFFSHNPVKFAIFIVIGCIVTYTFTFFMELALAKLADGGNLKDAFNFPRIKRAIDMIGWKRYTIGYSKIIIIVSVLFVFFEAIDHYLILSAFQAILNMMIFLVEFRGIGIVYKVYTDKKLEELQMN